MNVPREYVLAAAKGKETRHGERQKNPRLSLFSGAAADHNEREGGGEVIFPLLPILLQHRGGREAWHDIHSVCFIRDRL